MKTLAYLTLALIALTPSWAPAAEAPATVVKASRNSDMLEPAWQELESRVGTLIGKDKQHTMVDLAYASLAADVCKTMVVEKKTYYDELAALATDPNAKRSPEEQADFERNVMVYLGVYIGLLAAESHMDSAATFCADAKRTWDAKRGPSRFWTAPPAAASR